MHDLIHPFHIGSSVPTDGCVAWTVPSRPGCGQFSVGRGAWPPCVLPRAGRRRRPGHRARLPAVVRKAAATRSPPRAREPAAARGRWRGPPAAGLPPAMGEEDARGRCEGGCVGCLLRARARGRRSPQGLPSGPATSEDAEPPPPPPYLVKLRPPGSCRHRQSRARSRARAAGREDGQRRATGCERGGL